MTNSQPKLSSRRPGTATTAEERLKKLSKWTEDPAAEAAASIEDSKPSAASDEVVENVKLRTALSKKSVTEPKRSTGKGAHPWDGLSDTIRTPFILKPTEKQHAKLKFIGETTYGESMQSIANKAIEMYIDAVLKERGIHE